MPEVLPHLISFLTLSWVADGAHPLVVQSPAGTFNGLLQNSPYGFQYFAFRKIPYAQPPIGNLRFAKPQPLPKLEEVYNATMEAPSCLQPSGVNIAGGQGQEDCLFLNVFTPPSPQDEIKVLKKVMVYIHGGAFFMGSGTEYVPGDLVARGDIIVVTFNYRLAWLGFLKGKTKRLPGNQGYWDQLMALQWVNTNIQSFGGDPQAVTLAGQSMGGESVSVWSIVPYAGHLFNKGIVMSGTIFTCPSTPGSSDVLFDLLLDRVGCWPQESQLRKTAAFADDRMEKIIACLRGLPAEAFVLPPEGTLTNKFTSIDGDLFLAPVPNLIQDRQFLEALGFYDKSFLVTLVNHEGAPFSDGIFASEKSNISEQEFLSHKVRVPLEVIEKAHNWYSHQNEPSVNIAHDIWSDPILAVPTFDFLDVHSNKSGLHSPHSGSSYFLWFNHRPSYLPPPHQGTFHSLDLSYVFDFPPSYVLKSFYHIDSNATLTEEDLRLRSDMIDIVANFVKSGNPGENLSKPKSLNWPAYQTETQHFLNFGLDMSVAQFPLKDRRNLWTQSFPAWMEEYRKNRQKEEL